MTGKRFSDTEQPADAIEPIREKLETAGADVARAIAEATEVIHDLGAALARSREDKADLEIASRVRADLVAGRDEALPSDVAKALLNGTSPIRVYRKYRGLTQDQLAGLSGVDQATISDLENGRIANPGVRTVKSLAKALGVTIDDLVL